MALKTEFYSEIFENEQKWIEQINNNLLNSIYCSLSLKPFYVKKKQELDKEIRLGNNQIIKQISLVIEQIINHIDILNEQHNNSQNIEMNSLLPLFLVNQMNNSYGKMESDVKDQTDDINKLKARKQVLENIIKSCDSVDSEVPDYVYDDFPEEIRRIK